jgi:condensin complex subunit 2
MAIHFDDDDEDEQPQRQPSRPRLVLDDGGDEEEEDEEGDDEYPDTSPKTQSKARRQSMVAAAKKPKGGRRRRRSSARFLKLGGGASASGDGDGNQGHGAGGDDEDHEDDEDGITEEANDNDLGAMYQKAIRMNAENRINATNSWNLSLIDHLDRFLSMPGAGTNSSNGKTGSSRGGAAGFNHFESDEPSSWTGEGSGVNFTRASCTLDASVKIYSYRVDDVHLTSYKVLANLNRTETSKKGADGDAARRATTGATSDHDDDDKDTSNKRKSPSPTNTDTLEQNVGK